MEREGQQTFTGSFASEILLERVKSAAGQAKLKPDTMLPEDFQLGDYNVLCGRGSGCYTHIGNKRFRKLVERNMLRYSKSSSKLEKTSIICEVVEEVREASTCGGFVRKDPLSGRFYEVNDSIAREKTSQAFRDALRDQSVKLKKAANMKWRIAKLDSNGQPRPCPSNYLDDGKLFFLDSVFLGKLEEKSKHVYDSMSWNSSAIDLPSCTRTKEAPLTKPFAHQMCWVDDSNIDQIDFQKSVPSQWIDGRMSPVRTQSDADLFFRLERVTENFPVCRNDSLEPNPID